MVKRRKKGDASMSGGATFIFLYLLLSIFSALVFSILFRRSINKGNGGIGWLLLTVVSAFFYGVIAVAFIKTSSPNKDAGYFWLGCITLLANAVALLLLVKRRAI